MIGHVERDFLHPVQRLWSVNNFNDSHLSLVSLVICRRPVVSSTWRRIMKGNRDVVKNSDSGSIPEESRLRVIRHKKIHIYIHIYIHNMCIYIYTKYVCIYICVYIYVTINNHTHLPGLPVTGAILQVTTPSSFTWVIMGAVPKALAQNRMIGSNSWF